jgi:hypothetical protein
MHEMTNFRWAGIEIGNKERMLGDKIIIYGPATVNGDTYNWMLFDFEGGEFYFNDYPPEVFSLNKWKEEAVTISANRLVLSRQLVELPALPTL